jgi:ribonuclease D
MIIKTTDELAEICERGKNSEYITVDTEFTRKKGAYYPDPSLIQLSIDGKVGYIFDLLDNSIDFQLLRDLLTDQNVMKVFHSSKQDLDVIYKFFQCQVSNICDLQIAAMFLGGYNNPSYYRLVRDFLGLKLDKELQFSDWKVRPLCEKQAKYAEKDVTYLFQLFPLIRDKLSYEKYLWFIEEMENISKYDFDSVVQDRLESTALKIVHKKQNITPRYLSLLDIALRWRENYSLTHNIVRNRVIDSSDLCEFIYKLDKNLDNLDKTKIAKGKVKKLIINEIEEAIKNGIDFEKFNYLVDLTIKKRDIKLKNSYLYDSLKALANSCGIEKSIYRGLIYDKSDIVSIAAAKSLTKKFNYGWRYNVFGCEAEVILQKHL